MTKLLLRLFIGNKENIQSQRSRVGKLSGIVGIFSNILLCAAKLIVGTVSGSVSITADAMNNLSDASAAVVTLLGFKLAEKPADKDHPYGHARFEYLSGLAVSALIILIGFELAKTSIGKIIHPAAVEFSVPLGIVLVLSILIKLWLCLFNKKLSGLIGSSALNATASDSRNDAISTTAVLIAALAEMLFDIRIDGFIGLGVAVFILYSGAMLAKETISPLLGENAGNELKEVIIEVVESNPKVLGFHDLMVHDYGPGQRFASMHVEMDAAENPIVCHDIIDNLERACLEEHNIHLIIHYDPVITGDKKLEEIKQKTSDILKRFDSRLSLHDFRMVEGVDHTNLIFDVAMPYGTDSNAIKSFLDSELEKEDKKYYTVITFDSEAFN